MCTTKIEFINPGSKVSPSLANTHGCWLVRITVKNQFINMDYRGRGRFPGHAARFQYPRPGGPALLRPRAPAVRPSRGLLAAPPRPSFEASRAPRPRQFTPRGAFNTPFRGFKATPMIPRSEVETPPTGVKGTNP